MGNSDYCVMYRGCDTEMEVVSEGLNLEDALSLCRARNTEDVKDKYYFVYLKLEDAINAGK